jgi:hypothetical protein
MGRAAWWVEAFTRDEPGDPYSVPVAGFESAWFVEDVNGDHARPT